jgi:hypothetical protein
MRVVKLKRVAMQPWSVATVLRLQLQYCCQRKHCLDTNRQIFETEGQTAFYTLSVWEKGTARGSLSCPAYTKAVASVDKNTTRLDFMEA